MRAAIAHRSRLSAADIGRDLGMLLGATVE
jgi:hypothetical protein